MKRSLIFSAIAVAIIYLVKLLFREEEKQIAAARPRKHLTRAFAKAKQHALAVTE